jgi:fumarate reductase subunit C
MRISVSIKLIGILCIVFGALGIMNHFMEILIPQIAEITGENKSFIESFTSDRRVILTYSGLFVDGIYLTAGILFLKKKSFSLKIIYTALSFSIIYSFFAMMLLNGNGFSGFSQFLKNPIFLISPLIDAALLVGVILIAKYYYTSPKEITELKLKKGKFILNPFRIKVLTFVGLFFLSVPLSIYGLWIYACNVGTTQPECVEIFNGFFPEFLHDRYDTSILSLVFCLIAIIISIIGICVSKKIWNKLNLITLVFSAILLMLNLIGIL